VTTARLLRLAPIVAILMLAAACTPIGGGVPPRGLQPTGDQNGLNRRRWKTRVELANAIFEYLEVFHNRQRRHSALEMRTPIEHERLHTQPSAVA
jgi:transposase InsO family protein